MADLTYKSNEYVVGSGHATLEDTINRLALVEHNTDGTHKIDIGILPPGAPLDWPTETVPDGFLERDGSSLSRTTYANLYAEIGTLYGAVDANHFNLMDDRGKFPRYWDHGKGVDPDAATRTAVTTTGATMSAGDHVGTTQADEIKSHAHNHYIPEGVGGTRVVNPSGTSSQTLITSNSTGGNETRSINYYVMPLIKY